MTNIQFGLFQNAPMFQNTIQSQDDMDSKENNSNMMHLENIPDDIKMQQSPKIFINGTRTTLFFIFSGTTEQQINIGDVEINVQSTQTSVIFDFKNNEEFELDAYLRSGYLQKTHINKFIKQSESLILDGSRQIENQRVVVELIIDTQKYLSTDVLSPDFSDCGLINEGNTCYMNSLLQILSHIRSFKNIIYSIKNVTMNKFPASLQELFYAMDQNRNSQLNIKKLLQSFDWSIDDAWVQHDVQEFFMMLLEGIDTRMKQISGMNEDSDVIRLFSGKLQIKLNCIHVEECSQNAESFTDIQLVVQGTNNLNESLKLYVAKEQLRGDNCYFSNTHGLQEADKYITFQQLPEVLIFHLKRFAYIDGQMKKLLERFEFPEELSMGQFTSNNDPQEYSLYGVLTHSGDTLNSGHYVAYIKDFGSGQWVSFNDQTVRCVTSVKAVQGNFGGSQRVGKYCTQTQNIIEQSQVQKQSAYMLVYIRSADLLSRKSIQPIPQWLIERQQKQSQQEQRILQRKELFQIQMIKYERVIEVVDQVKSFGQRGLILKRPVVNQRNSSYQNDTRLIQLQAKECVIPSEQTLGEFITVDNQQAFIYRALWDQRGILRAEVIFSIKHYNRIKANVLKKALTNSNCTPLIITISQFTYDLGGDYIIFIKCIRKDSITLIPPMRLTQDLDLYSFTQQLIRDNEILQNCDLFIEDPYFQLHRVEEKLLREPIQKIYQTLGIASNCTLVFIEPKQQLNEMYEFECVDGQFNYLGNVSLNQNSSYEELTIAIEAQGQFRRDELLIKYWNGRCHQEIDLDIVQKLVNLESIQETEPQSLIPYISKHRNELMCINHPVPFIHRQTQIVWEFSVLNESRAYSLGCQREEIISTVIQRQLPQHQHNSVLLMDSDQKYLEQVFAMQKISYWTVDKVLGRNRLVLFYDEDLQQNLKKTLIICNFRIGYKKYDTQLHPFWLYIDENSTLQNLISHIHDTLQKKYSYDDRKVLQITLFASTDKTLTSSTGIDIRNMQLFRTIGQSFSGEMGIQKKVYIDIQKDQSIQLKLNCN